MQKIQLILKRKKCYPLTKEEWKSYQDAKTNVALDVTFVEKES